MNRSGRQAALEDSRILPLVDFLSTVSGGGYIGSALSTLLSLNRARVGKTPAERPHPKAHIFAHGDRPEFDSAWARFPFRGDFLSRNARRANDLIAHLRNDAPEAIRARVIADFEKAGATDSTFVRIHIGLGAIACANGEYSNGVAPLLKAHEAAARLDNAPLMCHAASNLSLCYYRLGMAAEHRGPFEWFKPWIGCRDYVVKGNPAVAEALFRGLTNRGVRMFASRKPLNFDDNISVPSTLLDLDKMPVTMVPVMQNCTVPPFPDQHRCYAVGQALGDFIRKDLPADMRVGLIGSGGLSASSGRRSSCRRSRSRVSFGSGRRRRRDSFWKPATFACASSTDSIVPCCAR